MRWASILVALAVICITEAPDALPFVRCSAESYTTGGLSPGDGAGVWVPSDFQVDFDCAAMASGPPDPAPVYALFNSLFGFESRFPLPEGRFEIDAERTRPLYRFVPEDPESFGQWWQAPTQAPVSGDAPIPEPGTALLVGVGLLILAAGWRLAPRRA